MPFQHISVALPASRIFAEQTTALGTESYVAGTGNPTLTTGDAPDSICPSGWRLPKNDGDKSYNNLLTNVYTLKSSTNVDTSIIAIPFGFSRFGALLYSNGNFGYQRSNGYFWANRNIYLNFGTGNAYYLSLTSSIFNPKSNANHGFGFSLRCLAR